MNAYCQLVHYSLKMPILNTIKKVAQKSVCRITKIELPVTKQKMLLHPHRRKKTLAVVQNKFSRGWPPWAWKQQSIFALWQMSRSPLGSQMNFPLTAFAHLFYSFEQGLLPFDSTDKYRHNNKIRVPPKPLNNASNKFWKFRVGVAWENTSFHS